MPPVPRQRINTAIILVLGILLGAVGAMVSVRPHVVSATTQSNTGLPVVEQTALIFESVARVTSPAVVYIEARPRNGRGNVTAEESGSGVLVRPGNLNRSLIVTNLHVVQNARVDDIDIHLWDGRLLRPVRVWSDPETDLALLDPGDEDLAAAKLGDSDDVHIGQWVLAIGSPFGLSQSVTHGIISAKHRRQVGLPGALRNKEFLQTDAAINPGNSGGPLVNLRGEVIGINTAIASSTGSSSGVGFSIPVNLVRWVTEELVTYNKVRRGFLGVEFPNTFTIERARKLGLTVVRGAVIDLVHANSPADRAGLRPHDVILEFDNVAVEDENHLINVVSQTPIGREVPMVVWRDRRHQKFRATLGSWEDYQTRRNAVNTTPSLPAGGRE